MLRSTASSLRLPPSSLMRRSLHEQVHALVLFEPESKALVEATGIGVELVDHVAQRRAGLLRFPDKIVQEVRAYLPVLEFGQDGYVEQSYLFSRSAYPEASGRLSFKEYDSIIGF